MAGAELMLRRALAIDPELAKTHFFLGTVLKSLGRYDEALGTCGRRRRSIRAIASCSTSWAACCSCSGSMARAVEALTRVLAVDPEDLQAHYNLMLAYHGLGESEQAAREEALYRRFKADEASQAITGPYRQLHPDDNNERQSIHEHRSSGAPVAFRAAKPDGGNRRVTSEPVASLPAVLAAALAGSALMTAATLPTFTDVTTAAGIRFRHDSGAFGKKYLPETMGAGGAFLDADGDGCAGHPARQLDAWPGRPARKSLLALYRNNRDGTFTDVTAASGLGVELYGLGAAAGDYDNDGRTDLYITALGRNRLFRNLGGMRFADVTDARRRRRHRLLDGRGMARLRPRRPARSVRRQLRRLVDREGPVLHARRQVEVVLHARVVQGSEPGALSQPGTARSRTRRRRPASTIRPRSRSASRSSTTTATAGSTCSSPTTRSRTACTEQAERHVHRHRRRGGRGVQRSGRGARRHGRRRRRLRRLRPAQPGHRQLLQRDDGALPRTRGTASSSTRRRPRPSAGRRC